MRLCKNEKTLLLKLTIQGCQDFGRIREVPTARHEDNKPATSPSLGEF
jgi:hypothetical protein